LVERVRAAPRGVLVAGPLPAPGAAALRAAVRRFAAASGYVLLAEATSQLRFGPAAPATAVGAFDALLRSPTLRERLRPVLALELGAPAVSAQWLAWISGDDAPARLVLPGPRPADPAGGALGMLLGPVAELLDAAAAALEAHPRAPADDEAGARYRCDWQAAEAAAWQAHDLAVADADGAALHEHQVAGLVRAALPPGATLMIGNSSPVRDLDHDLPPDSVALTVLHQRGTAGIDGLVSGAAGAASARGLNAAPLAPLAPLALLIGDVALLHDAGGLAAAAAVRGPLVIVVVHNDGGRIFERLPLGRDETLAAARERLFVAPHGRVFDGLAATWGLGYARVETPAALSAALAQALAADRAVLIEARVAPGGSARRAALLAAMAQAALAADA
jgi:2-succinyl-5-enolpyruvyl-6-hydroxy-3-cyclohexene-1-carboxylate synthase